MLGIGGLKPIEAWILLKEDHDQKKMQHPETTTESFLEPTGVLTFGDIARSQYFHITRRYWPLAAFAALFATFMLLISVFSMVLGVATGETKLMGSSSPMLLYSLAWLSLIFVAPLWVAKRQQTALRSLGQPIQYHFGEERVRLEGANFSSEFVWPLVKGIYETKTLFVVYQSRQAICIVPKRFFGSDERKLAQFRSFAAAHLLKPTLYHKIGFVGRWF
jgi:hypothetical protein